MAVSQSFLSPRDFVRFTGGGKRATTSGFGSGVSNYRVVPPLIESQQRVRTFVSKEPLEKKAFMDRVMLEGAKRKGPGNYNPVDRGAFTTTPTKIPFAISKAARKSFFDEQS